MGGGGSGVVRVSFFLRCGKSREWLFGVPIRMKE